MVIIGLGRNDPRRWVKATYAVLDTMKSGETGPRDPVPSKAELARKMRISADTAGRALLELADMGIVYQVPGHGYFPSIGAGMTTSSLAKLHDEWLYLTVTRGCPCPMLNEPSIAALEYVSAEAACEFLHKASPRRRLASASRCS